jgi:transmembrane sensor
MTLSDPTDPRSEVRSVAREWVMRLADHEMDAEDMAELRAWRAVDTSHQAAFEAERRAFRAMAAHGPLFARDRRAVRLRRLAARAPTMVSTLAACALLWVAIDPVTALMASNRTGSGETAKVHLADGSVAMLNSESAIAVDFDGKTRRVRLLRGEAWFQVAHDREHPFIVETDDSAARAVGTAFGVRRVEDGGTELDVTQGIVSFTTGDHSLLVRAGEAAEASKADGVRALEVDPERRLAWRSGKIIIDDESVGAVAAQLSRYRRGTILVLGDAAEKRVSGVLSTNDLDRGLEGLVAARGLTVTRFTPWLTILR